MLSSSGRVAQRGVSRQSTWKVQSDGEPYDFFLVEEIRKNYFARRGDESGEDANEVGRKVERAFNRKRAILFTAQVPFGSPPLSCPILRKHMSMPDLQKT